MGEHGIVRNNYPYDLEKCTSAVPYRGYTIEQQMASTGGADICVGGNEDTWLIRVLDVVVLMVVSLRVCGPGGLELASYLM